MSIGYSNPIGGSNVAFSIFVKDPKSSGGAIRGWMPQQTQNVDKRYPEYEQIRWTLKEAWNTTYPSQLRRNNLTKSITTPFRAVNNAGDLLSRENYSCGGTCQTPQSRPNVKGLRQRFGAVQGSCTPSASYNSLQLLNNIPAAARASRSFNTGISNPFTVSPKYKCFFMLPLNHDEFKASSY